MKKRCMSILLVFCMVWTLFPASTLAEMSDGDAVPIIAEADATSSDETSVESAALSDAGDAITRGAWMRELVNLFGLTLNKDEYPDVYFPDIEESEYFNDIMVATKYGFVDVEAGDNFEPDAPLTRECAAWTLNFYLGIQNAKDSYTFSDASDLTYPDDAQVAVDCGWFALTEGQFNPNLAVTAEECAAMREYAAQILAGRNTETNVADYEFADFVKVISNSAEVASKFDTDTGTRTVIIKGYSDTLSNGDTFAYYYEDFAFVFLAKSVQSQDGVFTVVTEDAPEGAILKYEFAGKIEPEITDFIPDSEPVTLMAADGDTVTFGEAKLLAIKDKTITFGRDIFKSNGVKGTLTGKVEHLTLDTKFITLGRKYAVLTGDITISSSVDIDLLNDPKTKGLPLGTVELGDFGYAGVELTLKWDVNFSFTYKASFKLGAEYENGKGSLIKDWKTSGDNCFSAEGTVSAQLALTANLDFGANGYAYASLSAGPIMTAGLKQYASGTPRQCITLSGYLYAGLTINVKLQEAVTKAELYKYNDKQVFFGERNSPVHVYHHIEDGAEVSSCTRGKDSGTTTGTYRTPKYVTPSNSRYYAPTNANVSSTGYSGYGSTEPVVIWSTSDNGDGTITITGYSGNASILNIPETIDGKTVTTIGEKAFQNKTGIRIVSVPDTVTSIGRYAFAQCSNLASASLSKSLTTINDYAFKETKIQSIDLPEGLTQLGNDNGQVFANCASLESVYIPSTLETVYSTIGWNYGNFMGCNKLDSIEFGEGIPSIPFGLFAFCDGITHIEIPDTVTSIGRYAFAQCSNLASVSLSKSLTTINDYAFKGTKIQSIDLPEGLTQLGNDNGQVFANCASLESVYIPSTLETVYSTIGWNYGNFMGCNKLDSIAFGEGIPSIPFGLFAFCDGITHIEIPDTVTNIGRYAFAQCSNLASVSLSKSLTTINDYAFKGTKIQSIDLPEGLTQLGNDNGQVFANCANLESVYIPSTLETVYSTIGWNYGNFMGCNKLDSITFGEDIPSIPFGLFAFCDGITHIEIPDTVTSIGRYAFVQCSNLASISLSESLTTINDYAFKGTKIQSIDLPEGLTQLGNDNGQVFANCANLESVYIPSTLETVYSTIGWNYGNFMGCNKLDSITFGEGIPFIPFGLFAFCDGITHIEIPDTVTSIGRYAFRGCANLSTVTIPISVTAIGEGAFYNSGLTSVTIPDTVTSYNNDILRNCTKLENVNLSRSAVVIPASMFAGCSSLESIEIPNGVEEIKNDTFNGDASLKSVTLPDTVTKIGNNAFNGCAALTDLTWIPNAVTSIGSNTFENCVGLTNAILPDMVSGLGGSAFKGCASLTAFKGGANLQTVGANCFQDCAALTDVKFANGLTSIGNYAFQNCAALETIALPDSVTSIGTYAFQKDAALKNVTLSSGLTQIPSYAFANCTSMTELEIPDGVTTIKDHAFYQDTKLKTFVIPASVSKIEDNAFSYPTTTTVYGVAGSYAETYAKWAAFLDIAQYRKTGTMGDAQELQWTYAPDAKTVTVTGSVSANEPVYVGSYDANGKMLSVKMITASNGTAKADGGANTVMLFWLDSNFAPKCGKATIRNV